MLRAGADSCLMQPTGSPSGCPAQCEASGALVTFTHCKRCDVVPFDDVLACRECEKGYDRIVLDDYQMVSHTGSALC